MRCTRHKVLQGLLDQHTYGKSALALELAAGLAAYIGGRVERLIARRGMEHHFVLGRLVVFPYHPVLTRGMHPW